MLSGMIEVLVV